MPDTIDVLEQLRNEVTRLRHRVTELEAQAIPPEPTAGFFPPLAEPFAALFRASPVAVVITAVADERYLDVNDHFARITGYAREEVIGRTSRELGIWADLADRERVTRSLWTQSVVRDIELTFRTKHRELRTVVASLALIDYAGMPCVLTMCHDITERQLAALERERLLQEAQAAIHVRDEFVSVAAHELKTPITALQLQVESMQRLAGKGDASAATIERIGSRLTAANHQIDRLTQLINELLDVTRIREGQLAMRWEVVDLAQLVATVAARFEEQFAQAHSALTLELAPGSLINGDSSSLDHIVTNLLSNALKYGRGQPIEVKVSGDEASVSLVVRDYGIGIAAADQHRIFERFERAVSPDHYGGLGLGLYVVSQLVTALHGLIVVESEPGSGATFKVTFPRLARSGLS